MRGGGGAGHLGNLGFSGPLRGSKKDLANTKPLKVVRGSANDLVLSFRVLDSFEHRYPQATVSWYQNAAVPGLGDDSVGMITNSMAHTQICLSLYIYIYIYIFIFTYIHTYIHTYIQIDR